MSGIGFIAGLFSIGFAVAGFIGAAFAGAALPPLMARNSGLPLFDFATAALLAALADLLAFGISPSLNSLRTLGQNTML
ncbi:MAG TPA: hypothetical protein VFJ59_13420 [Pseudolabrys sp.]|nr:hypothetical protein [Pseudolabrys sp.]